MSYGSGFLNDRVKVLRRATSVGGAFGRNSGGEKWEDIGEVWANVNFVRGIKALREGAMDAYDTVMVRCRWVGWLERDSLLVIDGKVHTIQSLNADKRDNSMQIVAREMSDGVDWVEAERRY